jgi:hypothetical protein
VSAVLVIEVRPKETSGEELADWDRVRLSRDIDPDGIYVIGVRYVEDEEPS